MQKIAIIGDTHFGRKSEHPLIKMHIKNGQAAFFDYIVEELKQRDIKTVFFTGDIHDTRQQINVEALVTTKRLLQDKMKDFDVHIILGNHDMYYENSYDTTALELFEDIPNVTVYRNNVQQKTILNKTWYIFPWVIQEKEEKMAAFLQKLATKPLEVRENVVLFGHFEMFGVNMEGNNISTFGLDPNLFLNASKLIISGHYHGISETVKTDSKLLYVGTPYPLTFANANQKHGIWILDENLELEFIENTISPTFVDVWDTDNLDLLPDLSNSFVRLYSNSNNSEEQDFEIRLKLEKKTPILIRLMPYKGTKDDIVEMTENEREANRILKMDTFSLSEIYIDQNEDELPSLKLSDNPKQIIMNKIKTYNETINV